MLDWFVRQGMQMGELGMGGGQNMNVNQQMVRPLLLNMTVVFLLPPAAGHDADVRGGEALGHDRAAADLAAHRPADRRSGKFLGAMALYARDAGGDAGPLRRCCSSSATRSGSRWSPRYLGLLLFGGCFISLGLFISSLTKNQIVAGAATFARVPAALGHQLDRPEHRADGAGDSEVPVDDRAPRRLRQGRHRHQAPGATTSASSPSACS